MSVIASKVFHKQKENKSPRFSARLAEDTQEIEQCLRLRYLVFAEEMGASLSSAVDGIDQDKFDVFCKHLMVFDNRSGKVIATTRLLLEDDAIHAGLFYSETEFDLYNVLKQPGFFMEVGRTCIHPDFRRGGVLAVLWHGIAAVIYEHKIDYLIGCASISLQGGDAYVSSVIRHLRKHHYSDESLRVEPRITLPINNTVVLEDVVIPTLLKGYLNQGALICGEPYWDADFDVADVFVLLSTENLADRYQRHFTRRD